MQLNAETCLTSISPQTSSHSRRIGYPMIPDSCPSAARVIRRKPRRRWAGATARGGCRSETGGGCPAARSVEPISETRSGDSPSKLPSKKKTSEPKIISVPRPDFVIPAKYESLPVPANPDRIGEFQKLANLVIAFAIIAADDQKGQKDRSRLSNAV